jgi:hypothetical protein
MKLGAPIWFDDITIEHIHASKSTTHLSEDCFRMWDSGAIETNPVIWFEGGVKLGNCVIRDVSRVEKSTITNAYLLQIDEGAEFDRLIIDNVTQKNLEGVNAPFMFNKGTIGTHIERDINC